MKRLLSFLFWVSAVMTTYAQQFEPNTKWPYLYEDFTDGTIFFEGNKKTECQLNVHLWGNKLHYLNADQKIFESNDKGVIRVEIGSDAYIFSDHQLVKLLATDNGNVLVELTKADWDAMFSGTGAYGASLNSSSSRDLSSLELAGLGKPELGLMLQERHDGREIPLKTQFFFIIGGHLTEANKGDVEDILNVEGKSLWKGFLKENKIKWKKVESLKKVLTFISQHHQ